MNEDFDMITKPSDVRDVPAGLTYWHRYAGYPRLILSNRDGRITYQDCQGKTHTVPWAEWEQYSHNCFIQCGYKNTAPPTSAVA